MAFGAGFVFFWGGDTEINRRQTPPRRRSPPPAEGCRSCPRGRGLAGAAAPGAGFSLPIAPAPAGAAAAPEPPRPLPFVPGSCEAGERTAHFCLLWTFSCLIPPPPRPATGCQGTDEWICCPATLLGRLRDVKEETWFASLWLLAGPEASALTSPSLHILSSNLQEDSPSFYSHCQQ